MTKLLLLLLLLLSLQHPHTCDILRVKNVCPSKTSEQADSLFRSSGFANFNVSRKYFLLKLNEMLK